MSNNRLMQFISSVGVKWLCTMISCSEGLNIGDLLGFFIQQ